jgi:enoyl-CoA hydratase/carnithine racemase
MKAAGPDESRIRTTAHPWGTHVVLSAPEVRNALDPYAVEALREVFARDEPGAVLLTADGPSFCAGGDVTLLARSAAAGDLVELLTAPAAAFSDLVEAVLCCPRPVVAVIDGPAVGGGVSLALACNVRLATPRVRLVLGWARWGLPPDGGAAALLGAAVGADDARALLAEGAELGTDSPLAPRLFTRVVAEEDVEATALATVSAMAADPGASASKAAAVAPVLAAVRAGREEELAALARAETDPSVVARLANVYKMVR